MNKTTMMKSGNRPVSLVSHHGTLSNTARKGDTRKGGKNAHSCNFSEWPFVNTHVKSR